MSYNINFTDPANSDSRIPLTVDDQELNVQTSLTFVGKNYTGYSQFIAENFLHLLENFARPSQPQNPVKGQIWYDTGSNSVPPDPTIYWLIFIGLVSLKFIVIDPFWYKCRSEHK